MPNAPCKIPRQAAYGALKPVKFWKSLNTYFADCLFLFVARMVTKQTTKDNRFQAKIALESLFRICGRKVFDPAAMNVMR